MRAMAITPGARKRILCVEDDENTRHMMHFLLDEYGYEAVIAASVFDALERARSGGFALCILDHGLIESNGIELCQQIRVFDSPCRSFSIPALALKLIFERGWMPARRRTS